MRAPGAGRRQNRYQTVRYLGDRHDSSSGNQRLDCLESREVGTVLYLPSKCIFPTFVFFFSSRWSIFTTLPFPFFIAKWLCSIVFQRHRIGATSQLLISKADGPSRVCPFVSQESRFTSFPVSDIENRGAERPSVAIELLVPTRTMRLCYSFAERSGHPTSDEAYGTFRWSESPAILAKMGLS